MFNAVCAVLYQQGAGQAGHLGHQGGGGGALVLPCWWEDTLGLVVPKREIQSDNETYNYIFVRTAVTSKAIVSLYWCLAA